MFFKRSNSSTPKNVAINIKNAAIDVFYRRIFKTRLLLPTLSRVFLKCSFIPSVKRGLKNHGLRPACFVVSFCGPTKFMDQ